MPKIIEQWLLFKYIDGQFTPLSKPMKSKTEAEKARAKYPERERKQIGVGEAAVVGITSLSILRALLHESTAKPLSRVSPRTARHLR
jgi:hypothetical protein